MKQVFGLDTLPSLLPEPVKPFLRPLLPVYSSVKGTVYSALPERELTTPYGVTILVDPANYVERTLAEGRFEPEYVEYFTSMIDDRDSTFYDIGANVGFFSLLHARKASSESNTFAFEPLPRNIERLEKNRQLNPSLDFDLYDIGLSNTKREATLSVSDDHPGEASLTGRNVTGDSLRKVNVCVSTLDEVADSLPADPDIMKIDVEGAEIDVLRGSKSVLERSQPDVLLELHPNLLKSDEYQVGAITDILTESGYSAAYHIEEDREMTMQKLDLETVSSGSQLHFF
jgi:FkbM family methyltransferase